jgi:hypothetical protein
LGNAFRSIAHNFVKEVVIMNNVKYKIGDKVIVRKDLIVETRYNGINFSADMGRFIGKVVTIGYENKHGGYSIKEEKGFWEHNWIDEFFEKKEKVIPETEEVTEDMANGLIEDTFVKPINVVYNNPATILFYKDINGKRKKVISKCEETDEYNKQRGLRICLLKAIARETQKQLEFYYNRKEDKK